MRPRFVPVFFALLLAAIPVTAAPKRHPSPPASEAPPSGPKPFGKWDDWTALTRDENGQTVCYAFAYPTSSVPQLAGRGRPVLTVTERPAGRDAVAFSAGYTFGANAEASLQVDQASLPFYTAGRFAFARDGAAVASAMRKGRQAVMHAPAPRGAQVTDTFGLHGFDQAYAAIAKACPAR